MTARSSFLRKIVYIIAIGVLCVFLYILGRPATQAGLTEQGRLGGVLARARVKYNLTQTQLGEIDPTSETIKLATLGMRGIAALVLWEKANDYKVKEDWAKYEATLKQIAIVQPHFISVWIHLAWNLSYNVSVEFDDYRDRYHWVIEGVKYLQKGVKNNNENPSLLWETGWVISRKIGRADEHKQFRKLFKADDEFHGSRPLSERDNWKVGKEWHERCNTEFLKTGKRVKGKSPLICFSNPAMCLMNFAEAIEEEGTFGQVAGRAWKNAGNAWLEFGQRRIPESENENLYLADLDKHEKLIKKYSRQLDDLEPGLRDKIRQKKYDALSKEQREAFNTPLEKRNEAQFTLAAQAEEQLAVSYEDIVKKLPVDKRAEAKKLAEEATKNEGLKVDISRARDVVNYRYWELRAEVEQTADALEARSAIHQGSQKYRETDLDAARDLFHQGLLKWRQVLDKYPELKEDQITGDDLIDVIKRYRYILSQRDEPFPQPFILQDILDKYEKK